MHRPSSLVVSAELQGFIRPLFLTLLTRMQTNAQSNKPEKFSYLFAKFILFAMALNVNGLTPDYFIVEMEQIQPGLIAYSYFHIFMISYHSSAFGHRSSRISSSQKRLNFPIKSGNLLLLVF